MKELLTSLRLVVMTMLICVGAYVCTVLSFAQILSPSTAEGSLIKNKQGQIIGSALIAQKFTALDYFWPRPSAVEYNASATGGSNKSPTSSALKDRADLTISQYGPVTSQKPLPTDLVAASGSGVDPHISEEAALYQVKRVAQARGISEEDLSKLVKKHAFTLGRFMIEERLVNVLELNLALDSGSVH